MKRKLLTQLANDQIKQSVKDKRNEVAAKEDNAEERIIYQPISDENAIMRKRVYVTD